jgi:adenylate cyclase
MPPVRRLTAILAADVAGYSRLMGADEEGTHARLQAHLRELIDPKIAEHHGRVVKNTGDGLLAEFPSVVDAVRCAVEVQRGMIDREPDVSDEQRIRFRIGINLGDVIAEGHDIFGDGVNVAARLEALAEPGGICISRTVRDHIGDRLPYTFEDMGEQSVKNIAQPVRAYAMNAAAVALTPLVAAEAQPCPIRRSLIPRRAGIGASIVAVIGIGIAAWWAWPKGNIPTTPVQAPLIASAQRPTAGEIKSAPRLSVVVLPFANLSNDPDQEYFADGITDDLTTDLSRISDSFVIARSTAFTYKGQSVDVKQIGRDLGVRYVLEGSVRRAGDQVQVNAQLIDAESGAHLWADRFDTDRANLVKAQDEITGRLARTLHLELVEAVGRRLEQEKAVNPDARDLVMRGWAWLYRTYSKTSMQEAQQAFERALEIDPAFIEAKVGLAGVLVSNVADARSTSVEQDKARAEQLLVEAIERDPSRSMAHWNMGNLRRMQNRLPEARIEFEKAIALDRNFARAYYQFGIVSLFMGQPETGIVNIEKAIRLNPHDPNIAAPYWGLGHCHLVLSHTDEAIELFRKAVAANSRLYYTHLYLAAALGLRGDLDEARAELAVSLKFKPEINSIARNRAYYPFLANPQYRALSEKTVDLGLRRAGFPDE